MPDFWLCLATVSLMHQFLMASLFTIGIYGYLLDPALMTYTPLRLPFLSRTSPAWPVASSSDTLELCCRSLCGHLRTASSSYLFSQSSLTTPEGVEGSPTPPLPQMVEQQSSLTSSPSTSQMFHTRQPASSEYQYFQVSRLLLSLQC